MRKFRITPKEKKMVLSRRNRSAMPLHQRRRRVRAAYPGKWETILRPITVEDLVLNLYTSERVYDLPTLKRSFEQELDYRVDEARDVFKSEARSILVYLIDTYGPRE